jgi:hypothetical protein
MTTYFKITQSSDSLCNMNYLHAFELFCYKAQPWANALGKYICPRTQRRAFEEQFCLQKKVSFCTGAKVHDWNLNLHHALHWSARRALHFSVGPAKGEVIIIIIIMCVGDMGWSDILHGFTWMSSPPVVYEICGNCQIVVVAKSFQPFLFKIERQ